MPMLRWRLLLGAIFIAALVGLCWLDANSLLPGLYLLPILLVVTVLATQELLEMLARAGLHPTPWAIYLLNVLAVASPLAIWGNHALGLRLDMFAVFFVVIPVPTIFIAEMCRYRKPGGNMANIAGGVFAWIYVGMMLQIAVWLRLSAGIGVLAAWIIVVKMGDIGAYTVGRLFGRHKMAPLISPGKTIEGAFGAMLFSCLAAWMSAEWLIPATSPYFLHVPFWGFLPFGLLVGGAGMVGDLAESLLKRDVGVKDSSSWLPGFGGVLDIIDSLLLSAPVAWLCWECGFLGNYTPS